MALFSRWFFGLGIFALGIGWLSTFILVSVLDSYIQSKAAERKEEERYDKLVVAPDIPSWLVGLVERTFFTILVAFNVSATAVAMIAWVTVKMLYSWDIAWSERGNITVRSLVLSALLGNLVSMLFALIGGLICRGSI